MTKSEIFRQIDALKPWFHSIDLGHGMHIQRDPVYGADKTYPEQVWKTVKKLLPANIQGLRVLDVGCNAGYFSVEMKRAGASYVLGIEAFPQYLAQAKLVRDILQIDLDLRELNVYQVTEDLGQFDITLFLGVLYHLKHPLLALEILANVTKGILVVESAILPDVPSSNSQIRDYGGPTYELRFVGNEPVGNEPGAVGLQNWFVPSLSCLKGFLQTIGFKHIVAESAVYDRAILVASRTLRWQEPDDASLESYPREMTKDSATLFRLLVNSREDSAPGVGSRDAPQNQDLNKTFETSSGAGTIRWFHSIDLGDGTVTDGYKPLAVLRDEAAIIFRHGVSGKSVLDIGAWDGFFSFEAERRGASKVLATDHFCWSGPGWGTKQGFDYVHKRLKSSVLSLDVDTFDLHPRILGQFDIVLFLGVLYHLKDPFGGLERASAMTDDLLIVETETAFDSMDIPVMRYYRGAELNNDPSNFWAPNILCLESMLREIGFKRFEFTPHPYVHDGQGRCRYILHAWRT
jgi:tRNA (mo5U34)-methyltransferase